MSTFLGDVTEKRNCFLCAKPKTGSHHVYYRDCYNSYKRQWYLRNRTKEIRRCAAYNKANPSVPVNSMARCRAKRPEFYREYARDYQLKHADKMAVFWSKSGAKKRAAKFGQSGLTVGDWQFVRELFGNACAYCGFVPKKLTQDHVIPISRGGVHDVSNILPACFGCNTSKGSKDVRSFLAQRNLAYSATLTAWLNARDASLQK